MIYYFSWRYTARKSIFSCPFHPIFIIDITLLFMILHYFHYFIFFIITIFIIFYTYY